MSYTPKTWSNGDVINATDLNKIEQGVADASANSGIGVMIVNYKYNESLDGMFLDKTYREIWNAIKNNTPVFIKYIYGLEATDSDHYVSNMFLAPVTHMYAYLDCYRINVSKAVQRGMDSQAGIYYGFVPAVMVFEVEDDVDNYPYFKKTIYPNTSYISNDNNV